MLGGFDVADVLVQLDFITLLGVGERSHGGLVLDFLLNDLLLQVGRVEFDEHLVGLHVLLGDLVALLDNFQNLGPVIADADLAFDLLRFERLDAAAFENGDFQRPTPDGEGGAAAGGLASPVEQHGAERDDENDRANTPARLSFDEGKESILIWHWRPPPIDRCP